MAPQCPFTIEYAPQVLDDIRLAVMDAFFSLPRGGAEIGGVLLGSHSGKRLVISSYEPLECEHAFGPGFTLSDRDQARLAAQLATPHPPGVETVGWYHSHTRSEIFLSESDIEIHDRFFPAPWQVALVLKPHTFQPTRAGFFFREPGGQFHASASYREFQLAALPIQPAPAAGRLPRDLNETPVTATPAAEPAQQRLAFATPAAHEVITVTAESEAEIEAPPKPAPAPDPAPAAVPEIEPGHEAEVPAFLQTSQSARRRWWKPVVAIAAGLIVGTGAYWLRQAWLPPVLAAFQHSPAKSAPPAGQPQPAALGLSVADDNGQLQIHWDGNPAGMRDPSNALLEIVDTGAPPRAIPLDSAHLRSGSFTYSRQGERVDVALSMDVAGAPRLRESTTYLGRAVERPEDVETIRRQRDDLARQNLKLESDVKAAQDHARRLQKSLDDLTRRLRGQQRQRLENQIPK